MPTEGNEARRIQRGPLDPVSLIYNPIKNQIFKRSVFINMIF